MAYRHERKAIRAGRLILRKRLGRLSERERAALQSWRDACAANREVYDQLESDGDQQLETLRAFDRYASAESLVKLLPRLEQQSTYRINRSHLAVAAALLAMIAVAVWLAIGHRPTASNLASEEILPGGNRATLTLADGRVINLDEAQKGIVVGTEAITYDDGSALDVISSEAEGRRDISLLELTTPKGGTYQITLPDGTKVWLNAASTLKYPSRFSGDSREVILDGEAYFDVVSMDRARITDARERSDSGSRAIALRAPFKVQTTTQTVQVLGTEFNLSAYADDPETKTTLVEGRVLVRHSERGNSDGHAGSRTISAQQKSVALNPGQQATVRGAAIEIHEVDTEQYVSWKSGKFVFEQEPLESIMKKLARWYDVEVVYAENKAYGTFTGSINRQENINEILEKIRFTQAVDFKIEGRRITVM